MENILLKMFWKNIYIYYFHTVKPDPLENCHLNVKELPKTWLFFFLKANKMSSFWQFFDIQMAIFRRVKVKPRSVSVRLAENGTTLGLVKISFQLILSRWFCCLTSICLLNNVFNIEIFISSPPEFW